MTTTSPDRSRSAGRADVRARTLRTDRWWLQPLLTVAALVAFIVYSSLRAFEDANYFSAPYISPFYSPCLTTACEGDTFPELFSGPSFLSPALYILVVPLGFRLTCYYYRKAYYRSFWLSPPACAVAEPHAHVHRRDPLPAGLPERAPVLLLPGPGLQRRPHVRRRAGVPRRATSSGSTWGSARSCSLVNAALLWLYSLSCHSCRHVVGGRLKHFSAHPVRYRAWTLVSRLNAPPHAARLGQPGRRRADRPVRPAARHRHDLATRGSSR